MMAELAEPPPAAAAAVATATALAEAAVKAASMGAGGKFLPAWMETFLGRFIDPGALPVLIIPAVALAVLYALNLLYVVMTPKHVRRHEHTQHEERRVRAEHNPFKLSTSRLDTHGNLLTSWQSPTPLAIEASDLSGWVNLVVVMLVMYLVSNATLNQVGIGHIFADKGMYAVYLFLHTPRLVLDIAVLVTFYTLFCLGYEYGILSGFLTGWSEYAAQTIGEAMLFLGPLIHARSHPEWPVTQRLAFLIEAAVLLMKAHSYIATNRHLQREVALGGPGTGTLVAEADKRVQREVPQLDAALGRHGDESLAGTGRFDLQHAGEGSGEGDDANGTMLSTQSGITLAPAPEAQGQTQADTGRAHAARSPRRTGAMSAAPGETPSIEQPATSDADRPVDAIAATGSSGNGSVMQGGIRQRHAPAPMEPHRDVATEHAAEAPAGHARAHRPAIGSFTWQHAHLTGDVMHDAIQRAWSVISNSAAWATNMLQKDSAVMHVENAACEGRLSGATICVSQPFWHRLMGLRISPRARAQPGSREAVEAAGAEVTPRTQHHPSRSHEHGLRQAVPPGGKSSRQLLSAMIWGINAQGRTTSISRVPWPQNISVKDFAMYSLAPTLVYEPNFPRTQTISLKYIAEKVVLAAVLVAAGIYLMQTYHIPVFTHILEMDVMEAVLRLALPTLGIMLIIWFVTFECVTNAFAEITHFGHREFYSDWYCSSTFTEFSRKWNLPTHEWLLRHLYIGSRASLGLSPSLALYTTFFFSIVMHELIIYGTLGPVFPFLAVLSCLQFPLFTLMRLPWFRGKRLGNIVFWTSLITGFTLTLVLYARNYAWRQSLHRDVMMTSNQTAPLVAPE